jgi:hypothetical protein
MPKTIFLSSALSIQPGQPMVLARGMFFGVLGPVKRTKWITQDQTQFHRTAGLQADPDFLRGPLDVRDLEAANSSAVAMVFSRIA